jgi:hypothetical protein
MKRSVVVLVVWLVVQISVNSQSLPAAGSGDYLISPGEYFMTSNIMIDVNETSAILGDCGVDPEPCVLIDTRGFGFLLSSAAPDAPLSVSGIRFTNTLSSGIAALNLTTVIGPLNVEKVGFENSSTAFISGLPPSALSISSSTIANNTAPQIINIFPTLDEFDFPIMSSVALVNLKVENNLREIPTINDSLISLQVQVIDLVSIDHCIFDNNANLIRIGESPTIVVSDGISHLKITHSTFRNHPAIKQPATETEPEVWLPLIMQTTTSHGPTWEISDNSVHDNDAPFLFAEFVDSISFQSNQFTEIPNAKIFQGAVQISAKFENNVYLRSGHIAVTTSSAFPTAKAFFSNETFDFQMEAVEANLLEISEFSFVNMTLVTFRNIEPGNVTTSPSVVHLQEVDAMLMDRCSFQDISFSNVTGATMHAGRVMVAFLDLSPTTTTITVRQTTFGDYSAEDEATADFVAQAAPGRSGTLRLVSSPSNALLNLARIATTTALQIQSPFEVRDAIFNRQGYGVGDVQLSNRLYVRTPVTLAGRVQLTVGDRVDFFWTPLRNGSLQVEWAPSFVPRVTPIASTRFAVDLGDGLSVPLGSRYTLISQSRATLPASIQAIALWEGRTSKPGFSGALAVANSATVLGDTVNEVVMIATPLCSIPCVVGDCNHREFCTCDSGWAGEACTCLEDGRPSGVACSNSTTTFEWVATSPQTIAPSSQLLVPASLTFYVNSDMDISGTLLLTSSSKLVVAGLLSVSGTVIMENEAQGYPYSCDFFTPTQITAGALATTQSSIFNVKAQTNNVVTCASDTSKRRDSSSSSSRMTRDFNDDNYDALVVVSSSAQLDGNLNVDASGVSVAAGKQQQIKLLVTNSSSSQTDLLTVSVSTQPEICSTSDKQPTIISVTFTVCNGEKRKTQWWWYGAPIIAVGTILIVIVVAVTAVPSWRRAIWPYTAK